MRNGGTSTFSVRPCGRVCAENFVDMAAITTNPNSQRRRVIFFLAKTIASQDPLSSLADASAVKPFRFTSLHTSAESKRGGVKANDQFAIGLYSDRRETQDGSATMAGLQSFTSLKLSTGFITCVFLLITQTSEPDENCRVQCCVNKKWKTEREKFWAARLLIGRVSPTCA